MRVFAILFFLSSPVFAGSVAPITYQGRILKPDGTSLETQANFRFTIKAPNGCTLWEEDQLIPMAGSKGAFSALIGTGSNWVAGSHSFSDVFNNSQTLTGLKVDASCPPPYEYNPALTDDRTLHVSFNDGIGGTQIMPSMPIKNVPFSTYASIAQKVMTLFDRPLDTGTPTNGQVLRYNGISGMWELDSIAGGVSSVSAGDGLTGGTIISTGTISLATTGVVAGNYGSSTYVPTLTVDAYGRITTAGSVAISIPAALTSLNGLTAPDQLFAVSSAGTLTAFTSGGSIHTLNIPMAATADAVGGLISNADYLTLMNGTIPVSRVSGTLDVSQIPDLDASQITTGTFDVARIPGLDASQIINGTLAQARLGIVGNAAGGTGLNTSSANAGELLIGNGSGFSLGTLTAGANININNQNGTITISSSNSGGTVTQVDSGTGLTGGPINGVGTLSLADTAVTPGGYGSPTHVSQFTVDQQGRLTNAGSVAISIDADQISSGTLANARLPLSGVTAGVFSSTTHIPSFTVDSYGRFVAVGSNAISFPALQWTDVPLGVNYASGSVGIGRATPATMLDVAGAIRVGDDATACAAGLDGAIRYSGSNVQYCNGVGPGWITLGISGSGLQSLNGLTANDQLFALDSAGTLASITSSGSLHTFHIPMAVTADAVGGLISNADYLTLTTGTIPAGRVADLDASKITSGTLTTNIGGTGLDGSSAQDGQILIGNGSGFTLGTLISGAGIAITNTAGSITIAATNSGSVTEVNTGDGLVGGPINGVGTISLGTTGVTAGTVGSANFIPQIGFDAFGRIVSVGSIGISTDLSALSGTLGVSQGGTGLDASSAVNGSFLIGNGTGFTLGTLVGYNGVLIDNSAGSVGISTNAQVSNTNNTIITRDGSGNFAAGQATLESLRLHNSGSYVTLQNPMGANYSMMLPADMGASGQVLSTNGTGALSWVTAPVAGGTFLAASGTESAPGIAFQADPDTGIWNPGANTLAISTGGTTRLTVAPNGNVGIGRASPATMLDVAGAIRVGDDSTACAAGLAGAIRYNGTSVQYCNGTGPGWQTLGISGSGLQSLNGLTANDQLFAVGSTGTLAAFTSAGSLHTLNIPLAATSGAVGGLVSNADYLTLMNGTIPSGRIADLDAAKITSGTFAQSRLGVVGNAAGGTGLDTSSASAGQLLIGNGSGFALSTLTAGSNIAINNQNGTITISSSNSGGTVTQVNTGTGLAGGPFSAVGTISLADTSVTAGGYGAASYSSTFTVDQQGRLTAAGSVAIAINANQMTSGTLNSAQIGDLDASKIVSGTLANARLPLSGVTAGNVGSSTYIPTLTIDAFGRITNFGSAAVSIPASITAINGLTASEQYFALGTAGTLAAFSSSGSIHTLNIPMASGAGVAGGLLSKADYDSFVAGAALAANGTIPASRGGTGLDGSAAAPGQLLVGTGSGYQLGTLISGSGISITNAAGSITISATNSGSVTQVNTGAGLVGGPITGVGTISLGTTGVAAGSVGSAGFIPQITFDAFGRITAVGSTAVAINLASASGTLGVANGGTGLDASAAANGALLIGNGSGFGLGTLVSSNGVLISTGAGSIGLSTNAQVSNIANTIITRDGTGGFVAGAADLASVAVRGSVTGAATITAPSSFTNYSMVLPSDMGSAGQVLRTNGTSQLSWVAAPVSGGTFLAASGTESAPGIAFQADTDTGLWNPGANTLAISTAGTARIFVNNIGNVGIGTMNPTEKLEVAGAAYFDDGSGSHSWIGPGSIESIYKLNSMLGSGSGNAYSFGYESATGSVSKLNINFESDNDTLTKLILGSFTVPLELQTQNGKIHMTNDGNVGIGTANPTRELEIAANDASAELLLVNNSSSTVRVPKIHVQNYVGGSLGYPSYVLTNMGGSSGAPGAMASDFTIGVIQFNGGYVGGGNSPVAQIEAQGGGSGAFGASDTPGRLIFKTTADGSGTSTERMRILESGAVGIGTTAIGSGNRLEVTGGAIKAGNNAEVRFGELLSQGSNYFALRAAGTMAGDVSFYLPTNAGTVGHALGITSAGQLGFMSVPANGGTFLAASGSAGTPGFSFSADTDTGMYLRGPGTLAFSASSNDRLFVNENGVGIGSASPNGALEIRYDSGVTSGYNGGGAPSLNVNRGAGNFAGVMLGYWSDGAADNDGAILTSSDPTGLVFATRPAGVPTVQMRISQSGAIGIGTTSIASGNRLEVTGGAIAAGNNEQVRFYEALTNGTNYAAFRAPSALVADLSWELPATGGTSGQVLGLSGLGTLGWISAPTNGGTFLAASGSAGTPGFAFSADPDTGLWNPGANTLAISTGGTTRFTIANNGFIGIGAMAPTSMLDIVSTADPTLTVRSSANSANSRIDLIGRNSGADHTASLWAGHGGELNIKPATGSYMILQDQGGTARIGIESDGDVNINGLHALSSGSIGIGTVAVQAGNRLEVAGGAIAAGNGGELRMMEEITNGTNSIGLRSPSALGQNYVMTLPGTIGTPGQVLSTDGTGNLSWINASSGVTFPLLSTTRGSVSTPAYSFSDDSDTGLWSPGANTLAISTGGTARVTIANNGNVGIGLSDPKGPLHLYSPANEVNKIMVGVSGSGNREYSALHLLTGGGGLGTLGAAGVQGWEVGAMGTSYTGKPNVLGFYHWDGSSWFNNLEIEPTGEYIKYNANGNYANFYVQNGATGSTSSDGLSLFIDNSSNASLTNYENGPLVFETNAAERFRITATGDVAIGTTAVSSGNRMEVTGGAIAAGNNGQIRFYETLANGSNYAGFRAPAALAADLSWELPAVAGTSGQVLGLSGLGTLGWITAPTNGGTFLAASGSAGTPGFAFNADQDTGLWNPGANTLAISTAGTTRVTVANNGFVGIGTTNPTATLTVNGSFARNIATITSSTHTIAATDTHIIANRAGTITLTLPTASTSTGREISIRTIQAQTVISASSNVVPMAGGSAGTAILPATAGKWVLLVSDGTNWQIQMGN